MPPPRRGDEGHRLRRLRHGGGVPPYPASGRPRRLTRQRRRRRRDRRDEVPLPRPRVPASAAGFVIAVVTLPEYRGRGIGGALVHHLVRLSLASGRERWEPPERRPTELKSPLE
ncbi:GNAT family N-acetyltransferase [Streptomyces sp. NPDC001443]